MRIMNPFSLSRESARNYECSVKKNDFSFPNKWSVVVDGDRWATFGAMTNRLVKMNNMVLCCAHANCVWTLAGRLRLRLRLRLGRWPFCGLKEGFLRESFLKERGA